VLQGVLCFFFNQRGGGEPNPISSIKSLAYIVATFIRTLSFFVQQNNVFSSTSEIFSPKKNKFLRKPKRVGRNGKEKKTFSTPDQIQV